MFPEQDKPKRIKTVIPVHLVRLLIKIRTPNTQPPTDDYEVSVLLVLVIRVIISIDSGKENLVGNTSMIYFRVKDRHL